MKILTKAERHKIYKRILRLVGLRGYFTYGLCRELGNQISYFYFEDLPKIFPEFKKYDNGNIFWFETDFHRIEALKEMIEETKP